MPAKRKNEEEEDSNKKSKLLDASNLTVSELRSELTERGVDTKGIKLKAQLVEMLNKIWNEKKGNSEEKSEENGEAMEIVKVPRVSSIIGKKFSGKNDEYLVEWDDKEFDNEWLTLNEDGRLPIEMVEEYDKKWWESVHQKMETVKEVHPVTYKTKCCVECASKGVKSSIYAQDKEGIERHLSDFPALVNQLHSFTGDVLAVGNIEFFKFWVETSKRHNKDFVMHSNGAEIPFDISFTLFQLYLKETNSTSNPSNLFYTFMERGRVDILHLLLEMIAEEEKKSSEKKKDFSKMTRREIARWKKQQKEPRVVTPLHLKALSAKDPKELEGMLNKKSMGAKCISNYTPLHFAVLNPNPDVLDAFLKAGGDEILNQSSSFSQEILKISMMSKNDGTPCVDINKKYSQIKSELDEVKRKKEEERLKKERGNQQSTRSERIRAKQKVEEKEDEMEEDSQKPKVETNKWDEEEEKKKIQLQHLKDLDVPTMQELLYTLGLDDSDAPKQQLSNRLAEAVKAGKKICLNTTLLELRKETANRTYVFPPNTSRTFLKVLLSLETLPGEYTFNGYFGKIIELDNVELFEGMTNFLGHDLTQYISHLTAKTPKCFELVLNRRPQAISHFNGDSSSLLLNTLRCGNNDILFQKLLPLICHHQFAESVIANILDLPHHLNALSQFLDQTNASVRVSAIREQTPLFKAVNLGYEEAIMLIASKGADLNEVLSNGTTLLVYSVHCGHLHISQKLKDLGAKIAEKHEEGEGESMDLDQVADINFLREISEPLFQGYARFIIYSFVLHLTLVIMQIFVLSGIFRREMSSLAQFVIQHGAEVSKGVTGKITHLLAGHTGRTEYGSITGPGSQKYADAMALKPKVVSEKWIDDQVKKRKRDRAIYLGEGTVDQEVKQSFWSTFFLTNFKQKSVDQLHESVQFVLDNGGEFKRKGEESILVSFLNNVHESINYNDAGGNRKTWNLILGRVQKEAPELINEKDSSGFSPLILSIIKKKFLFAEDLMKVPGVDVNEIISADNKQHGGESFLHLLSHFGAPIKLLENALSLGANPNVISQNKNKTPLINKTAENNTSYFNYLWSLPQVDVNALDFYGRSSVQTLIQKGNVDLFGLMNKRVGEPFDCTSKTSRRNLLHIYSDQKNQSIANFKYILSLPSININEKDGLTSPLLRYVQRNESFVAGMMIDAGAELNDPDPNFRPFGYSLQLADTSLSDWISRLPKLDKKLALEDASFHCSTSSYFFQFFQLFASNQLDEELRTRLAINILKNQRNPTDRQVMLASVLGDVVEVSTRIIANIFKNHEDLFDAPHNITNVLDWIFGFCISNPKLLAIESSKGNLLIYKLVTMRKNDLLLLNSLKNSPTVLLAPSSVLKGNTVFHLMAEKRELMDTFRELLQINPSGSNSLNENGETPLHLLLNGNRFNVVQWAELLVKNGSDPFIESRSGVSPVKKVLEMPQFLSIKILNIFISNCSDQEKKKHLEKMLEEKKKKTAEENERKKQKRSKKITEYESKKKELDEQFKSEKKQMKRAGSLGHLTDARGLSKTFEVPFIANVEGKWRVLEEGEKEIWDTTLNLVDIKAFIHGTNKYILQQLLVNEEPPKKNLKGAMIPYMGPKYMVLRESGTIGNPTKPKNERKYFHDLSEAKNEFEAHFLEATGNSWKDRSRFKKLKGKFVMVQKVYDVKISEETIERDRKESKLDPTVRDLVEIISDLPMIRNAMKHAGLDWSALPLGRVTSSIIEKALQILKDLDEVQIQMEEMEDDQDGKKYESLEKKIEDLSNEYYTLIPRDLSTSSTRKIDDESRVISESRLLEGLRDIGTAVDLITAPPGINKGLPRFDAIADGICSKIIPLDNEDEQVKTIRQWTGRTDVQVFKISRFDELQRFEPFRVERTKDLEKNPNNLLLFHGTRTSNVLGILRHGLRIAPASAPRSGLAFGKGVYFSDSFQKSLGYCRSNGTSPSFMFICEVAVGISKELPSGEYMEKPYEGTNSTKGCGVYVPDPQQTVITSNGVGIPCGPLVQHQKEGRWLQHNEYIVYEEARVKIKYLIKFDDHRKKN